MHCASPQMMYQKPDFLGPKWQNCGAKEDWIIFKKRTPCLQVTEIYNLIMTGKVLHQNELCLAISCYANFHTKNTLFFLH